MDGTRDDLREETPAGGRAPVVTDGTSVVRLDVPPVESGTDVDDSSEPRGEEQPVMPLTKNGSKSKSKKRKQATQSSKKLKKSTPVQPPVSAPITQSSHAASTAASSRSTPATPQPNKTTGPLPTPATVSAAKPTGSQAPRHPSLSTPTYRTTDVPVRHAGRYHTPGVPQRQRPAPPTATDRSKRIRLYVEAGPIDKKTQNSTWWMVKEKVVPVIRQNIHWQAASTQKRGKGKSYVHGLVYMMKPYDMYLGYLVEWVDGVESWEEKVWLQSGLNGAAARDVLRWCNRIDEFMADDQPNLLDFLRSHSDGIIVGAGADLDGLCGFRAIDSALSYLGSTCSVTDEMIHAFCQRKLLDTNGKINLWETGVTFNQLQSFVYTLPSDSGSLRIGSNLYAGYKCGWSAVAIAIVQDGIYLVCGESPFVKTGHVIVVKKSESKYVARDGRGETLLSEQTWIHTITFVRQVWWDVGC